MEIHEDIEALDNKTNRLKVEYEQYFAKLLKREPTILRDEVERIIRRYSNQPIHNTALRFKFNTLVARYVSYKQYWTRILRQIEEGTYERGVGVVKESLDVKQERPDLSRDGRLRDLYQLYIETKKVCHEPVEDLNYEGFIQGITQEAERVKQRYSCRDVDYKITVKEGKAKIIIKPVSGHNDKT